MFLFDGSKVIPVEFVTIGAEFTRTAGGKEAPTGYKVTVEGKLSARKGSPLYNGTFHTSSGYPADTPNNELVPDKRLAVMNAKMGALSQLFAREGKWLEVQPFDGSAPIKCKVRLLSLNFDKGNWFEVVPFTATFETEAVWYGARVVSNGGGVAESWSVEPSDDNGLTYRLTHQVSAQRKRSYDDSGNILNEGWEVARDMVVAQLGLETDKKNAAEVLGLTAMQAYNYVRNQQIDETEGRFAVTETWLLHDPAENFGDTSAGACIEEMQIEARQTQDQDHSYHWSVSVTGTITGLEERNNTTHELVRSKFDNAKLRWAPLNGTGLIHTRAQAHTGISLNPAVRERSFGENPRSGVINYSYQYDDRPQENGTSTTIEMDHAADVFAAISVPNRPAGPILQAMNSKGQKAITITRESQQIVAYGQPAPSKPSFDPLSTALSYIGSYSQLFVGSDRERWIPEKGSYSRTTTYVYQ